MQYPHRARLFARSPTGFGVLNGGGRLACLDRPRPAA